MVQQVKIKVQPDQTVHFPNVCVHCLTPAIALLPLRKRMGRITRLIDVPLCDSCARIVNRQSGEEERLEKLGRIATGVVALGLLAAAFFIIPYEIELGIRLVSILAVAALGSLGTYLWFWRRREAAALPEKKAILAAAAMTNFSWRATTFAFTNENYAAQFSQLNEPLLMEI